MTRYRLGVLAVLVAVGVSSASPTTQSQQPAAKGVAAAPLPPKLAAYKQEAAASIDGMYDLAQQMVDSVFSFCEIGFQEFETQRYLTAHSGARGLHDSAGHRRHSHRVDCALWLRPPGDRAGLRHRRHPAGLAEARRRVSGADRGRRSRARRGPQLGRAAQHRRRHRGEAHHAAGGAAWHAACCGQAWRRNCSPPRRTTCARACSRTWTSSSTTTSAQTSRQDGATAPATAWCRWNTRSRVRRPTAATHHGADAVRWMPWS